MNNGGRFVTRWIDGKGWVSAPPVQNCRHPRSKRMTFNHADWDLLYDCNICRACGEWLPMGPSNDSSEAVQVEIRAAQIATNGRAPHDGIRGQRNTLAGYLARCIVTHSEES